MRVSNGCMSLHAPPSAGTTRLTLKAGEPSLDSRYVWTRQDCQLCKRILQDAEKAGTQLTKDYARAVSRAQDPQNAVDLAAVVINELGRAELLGDPVYCAIATMAASQLERSANPALAVAGRILEHRVAVAKTQSAVPSDVPVIPSVQDENWDRIE